MLKSINAACLKSKRVLLLFVFFAFVHTAFAQKYFKRTDSFRVMGMGGAGLTTVSDLETLHYNPAAMANIQESFWDIAAVKLDYNEKGYEFTNQFLIEKDVAESTSDYFDFLQKYKDSNIYLRGAVESGFYNYLLDRGLVWGVLGSISSSYEITLDASVDISSTLLLRLDESVRVGMSIPFGMGDYVLGFSYGYIKRSEFSDVYKLSDTTTDKEIPSLTGITPISGNSLDVGFLYRMPHPSRFKFAVVARDIGGIKFEDGSREYTPIKHEVAAGFSVSPIIDRWTFKVALDFRDLTFEYAEDDDEDRDLLKRTHFGIEIGHIPVNRTFNIFAVRAGLNQGYPSFGVELNLGFEKMLVLGYAYYGEETGLKAGDEKEERNMLYVSIGF